MAYHCQCDCAFTVFVKKKEKGGDEAVFVFDCAFKKVQNIDHALAIQRERLSCLHTTTSSSWDKTKRRHEFNIIKVFDLRAR